MRANSLQHVLLLITTEDDPSLPGRGRYRMGVEGQGLKGGTQDIKLPLSLSFKPFSLVPSKAQNISSTQ